MPVFFDETLTGTNTNLSSVAYEQALRFIGFWQAIIVTSLVLVFFSSSLQDPLEIALYALTWAEWPVMLFRIVPMFLRRLTIRNSIEGKKDAKAINTVSQAGNDGLLRDFLVLVRLAGLGRRAAAQEMAHNHGVRTMVETAVQEFDGLNQTQQVEIWNLFAVWDADNTGEVSALEVSNTFTIMGFSPEAARESAESILRLVDDDNSGSFTWRKLQAATVLATFDSPQHEVEEDLATFFELIDENQDGRVSVFELTRGLRRMRIGLTLDDMANLLYRHFGAAKLQVSKADFLDWALTLAPVRVATSS